MSTPYVSAVRTARAQETLQLLQSTRKFDEQLKVLCDAPLSWTSFSAKGGAYNLRPLLEDPTFSLPHRSRTESERLVEAALQHHARMYEIALQKRREQMRPLMLIAVSVVLTAVVGVLMQFIGRLAG